MTAMLFSLGTKERRNWKNTGTGSRATGSGYG